MFLVFLITTDVITIEFAFIVKKPDKYHQEEDERRRESSF